MTLLEMLNAVLMESSHLSRSAFAASSNIDDRQMVALANRAAREIRDFYDWSALTDVFSIDPTDGPDASTKDANGRYPLPEDYRSLVPDSAWETDGSRKIDLPVPRGRWFMYKFSTLTDAGRLRARIYDKAIEVHEPSAPGPFQFEYVSKYVVYDSSGQGREQFTKDDETFRLDDNLLILGTQAWWAKSKMMPQAPEWMADYQDKLIQAVGIDAGGQVIGGSPTVDRRAPYYPLYRRV